MIYLRIESHRTMPDIVIGISSNNVGPIGLIIMLRTFTPRLHHGVCTFVCLQFTQTNENKPWTNL